MVTACNHKPNVTEIRYFDTSGGKICLLTQSDGANQDDADLLGIVQLNGGCFQIAHDAIPNARSAHIIWPEGFGVAIDGGDVLILDDEGRVVARIGERVLLGGSGSDKQSERHGSYEGPFWYVRPDIYSEDRIPSVFNGAGKP
jgi:hypothetical protein